MNVTKVMFSTINDRWYLEINNLEQIVIPEASAKMLIEKYKLTEVNLFRWEKI